MNHTASQCCFLFIIFCYCYVTLFKSRGAALPPEVTHIPCYRGLEVWDCRTSRSNVHFKNLVVTIECVATVTSGLNSLFTCCPLYAALFLFGRHLISPSGSRNFNIFHFGRLIVSRLERVVLISMVTPVIYVAWALPVKDTRH